MTPFRPHFVFSQLAWLAAALLLSLMPLRAADRVYVPLSDWDFQAETTAGTPPPAGQGWGRIAVPHVFRQSGVADTAAGWYRKRIQVMDTKLRRHLLEVAGAASVCEVRVNGTRVGSHRGAYTAAIFDLSAALREGDNELLLRVGNGEEESRDCLSRSSLYHTPGGLYRGVRLISTGDVRFGPEHGAEGVFISAGTPGEDGLAPLSIEALVCNTAAATREVTVRHILKDPRGKAILELSEVLNLAPGERRRSVLAGKVDRPRLWAVRQPVLHMVESTISQGKSTFDRLNNEIGFRRIELREGRFLVNGVEVLLRGVNKHHMDEWRWNALTDEDLKTEWRSVEELGVNTVRLAHYPHSRLAYSLADHSGILVWAENGLAGQVWKKLKHEENSITQDGERITREMVRQHWNHPSIVIWSSGNETSIDVASHYASLIRGEDTSRLVTYAAAIEKPRGCDFDAYNTYDGWYGGHFSGFSKLPRNAYVSETGAGSWATHHVPYGTISWKVDQFEPEEYQELFTEYRLQQACRTNPSAHPMLLWWNFREFYDAKFKGNRNTKGMLTLAGKPKDIYWLWQSFLAPERRTLHLCGGNHFLRNFSPDNGIKAYGSAASAELFINGTPSGQCRNGEYRIPDTAWNDNGVEKQVPGIAINNVFFWKATLRPGRNVVEVRDSNGKSASMIIHQTAPDGSVPLEADAPIEDLTSSNPANPAAFISRPVAAQTPIFRDVDGTADNTFDAVPGPASGASWIATRRTGAKGMATALSFRAAKPLTVWVMHSLGTRPSVALGATEPEVQVAAAQLAPLLQAAGFRRSGGDFTWRDHTLVLAHAALWVRRVKADDYVTIPAVPVDCVVLLRD